MKIPKKLIEVALPLDDINAASAYEKMPGIGAHPRGIHQWWARRPLAAAKAVIFAQMVNDPGYERHLNRGVNKEKAAIERERLFGIIRKLVDWENINNEEVLSEAREEIWKSWRETCELNKDHPKASELFNPNKLPAFHDPFAGGGAIPLEAQRLGLESWASDLNPVAVMINKAMVEIPPKFANKKPIGPIPHDGRKQQLISNWIGLDGLAEDIKRYAFWVNQEANTRLGHLYPKIKITPEISKGRADLAGLNGKELNVIAWLWARTVKSPNPAYSNIDVPLISTYILSSKSGKEAYVKPVVRGNAYDFQICVGTPPAGAEHGTKAPGRGSNFVCILSGTPISGEYIKAEGKAGRISSKLMAIVADGGRRRVYIPPISSHEQVITDISPTRKPSGKIPNKLTGGTCVPYGLAEWGDLFTSRQLHALNTYSDLILEAREKITQDAIAAGMPNDDKGLNSGGVGAKAYAEAICIYLAFAVDRCADFSNSCTRWVAGNQKVMNLFGKQAIAMTWDYPEANILINTVGGYITAAEYIASCLNLLPQNTNPVLGTAIQANAITEASLLGRIVSTDPPYYDNIGYADLSDFFYAWLRPAVKSFFPDLFSTVGVPKTEELVAIAHRHESKEAADQFFLEGMTQVASNIARQAHPAFPVTIYYAFKQSETTETTGTNNTGWETFLEAILKAGFAICGTWPMRSEQTTRMIGIGTNALASSIVLVCNRRPENASSISRREFMRELNATLPEALGEMTRGAEHSPVAPVDLSQAIIGPGMAIFSKYSSVLEADGKHMTVKTALQLINRFLAEDDFDRDTQFCLHWFETVGWSDGKFGEADILARAKGTSVNGLHDAGVIHSGGGTVRLLKWAEYPSDWSPETDARLPIWEALHQLIRALRTGGDSAAGVLISKLGTKIEAIRQLAYRLYTLCERKGWAEDARAYNELIASWQAIEAVAPQVKEEKQAELF